MTGHDTTTACRSATRGSGPMTDEHLRRPPVAPTTDPDLDLRRAQRHANTIRRCFYLVVLLVALIGQVTGAMQTLHIPLIWAIPAVAALELGGVVALANADLRRRLGEHAIGSRLLSAATAGWAVAFNWLAHPHHLQGAFYAGMSALGYLTWLTHTENQRRDRLRATGHLPPTAPAYELLAHWIRHPRTTAQARNLAKRHPDLGLYGSLTAARDQQHRHRRVRAISTVLHRKIRTAVDPSTADIAVAVYDPDEIARRLTQQADYDALTDMIAADLTPARLTVSRTTSMPMVDHQIPTPANISEQSLPRGHQQAATPPSTRATKARTGRMPATVGPVTAAAPDDAYPQANGHPTSLQNRARPSVYEPVSPTDAAMYQIWLKGITAGREPSGADLARAAGNERDTSGAGRRAARRYREAHANAST